MLRDWKTKLFIAFKVNEYKVIRTLLDIKANYIYTVV